MNPGEAAPAAPAVRGEIICSRLLKAPRASVFRAFSDPVQLAAWWGPQDFTNTFEAFDFRPGGAWRFTMHGPDATAYVMNHQFIEIVAPERIVVRHFQPGHDFTLTVLLVAQGDRTEVTWRMSFDDPDEGERLRAFLGPANEQNFDRLAAYLTATNSLS
jgi:uncharacterized protein YndB with AHSA1/START domain